MGYIHGSWRCPGQLSTTVKPNSHTPFRITKSSPLGAIRREPASSTHLCIGEMASSSPRPLPTISHSPFNARSDVRMARIKIKIKAYSPQSLSVRYVGTLYHDRRRSMKRVPACSLTATAASSCMYSGPQMHAVPFMHVPRPPNACLNAWKSALLCMYSALNVCTAPVHQQSQKFYGH
jgi:hypothetical protein